MINAFYFSPLEANEKGSVTLYLRNLRNEENNEEFIVDATSHMVGFTHEKQVDYYKRYPDALPVWKYDDEFVYFSPVRVISVSDYVKETGLEIKRYCFYSPEAYKTTGASVYEKPDGTHVYVTHISYSYDASECKRADQKYVGLYTLYTGQEWKFKFKIQYDLPRFNKII